MLAPTTLTQSDPPNTATRSESDLTTDAELSYLLPDGSAGP